MTKRRTADLRRARRPTAGVRQAGVIALVLIMSSVAVGCAASITEPIAGVNARVIVAIADGDFRASTYDDQILASPDPAFRDQVLVWSRGSDHPVAVPASNSVTSPPEVLAVSPDGRFAYVVERLGQRGPGRLRSPDLSAGGRLAAIPLDGTTSGSTVHLGPNPEAVDLRADGRMLAFVSNSPTRSLLHLVPVEGGSLGRPITFDLADVGAGGSTTGPRGGLTATSVFWRPGDSALAVTLNTQDRVAFFRVEGTQVAPSLVRWGAPVPTGRDPFTGRFTPDGRHFLSLDWGRDLTATSLEARLPTTPSRISVIRVAAPNDVSGSHRRIGGAPTDLSSEGIAISPDGSLVAAVSMRQTALPPDAPRYTPNASVVLLHLDGSTGKLTPVDRVDLAAVLPEGATFDRSSRRLLVTAFESRSAAAGALHMFDISGHGLKARLLKRGAVATPHGVHHVVVR